jgi:hypothetical protein
MASERVWYDPVRSAVHAATYVVCHTVVALLIIAATRIIALILEYFGDPKLYDEFPVRYIFDTVDLVIFLAFLFTGAISAWYAFKE